MEQKDLRKLIILVAISISFLLNSILFGWEATRRNADDVAKINQSYQYTGERVSLEEKIKSCLDGGGLPNYDGGTFSDCKKK